MYSIRSYTEQDAPQVGQLIADTYTEFNLAFASADMQRKMLGPFHFASSSQPEHQKDIVEILRSPIVFVAESAGEIVGVLRGRTERLASLFVHKDYHYRGIGRELVKRFESEMVVRGVGVIRLAATLYAVPFYEKLGYKKSTGVRTSWSFAGYGLQVQPMKRLLVIGQEKSLP